MKTVGLIDGMSWESTQYYYRFMNEHIQKALGKHHSIETVIYSVDFERFLLLAKQDKWEDIGQSLAEIAKKGHQKGGSFGH